ncbi:unnamed protein product [Rotaria socialis]|uniref:Uncharacterized protein n=1 Tax=Rotaria socialis TaxID=392032 RepID=A0A817UG14_9BILA|nr:unnamed protein product [Rotaria socialis]CAF4649928.1 unnamed protein product [Rotaria socialis]
MSIKFFRQKILQFSRVVWASDENQARRLASLRRWMPRLEVKVVDRGGTPVSYIGQQGEIWARGFPIMLGSYGDTQKTNEAITPSG